MDPRAIRIQILNAPLHKKSQNQVLQWPVYCTFAHAFQLALTIGEDEDFSIDEASQEQEGNSGDSEGDDSPTFEGWGQSLHFQESLISSISVAYPEAVLYPLFLADLLRSQSRAQSNSSN